MSQSIARIYLERGWHPLPIPANAKKNPPSGLTGNNGADITADAIADYDWTGNIAVRMPPGVVGVDVDQYADKQGYDTLTSRWRHFPLDAPLSTSRGFDGPSGIRFYALPPGWSNYTLKQELCEGVEIIQRTHRYALVAPSRVEDRLYEWSTIEPPYVSELPVLPARYASLLRQPERLPDTLRHAIRRAAGGNTLEQRYARRHALEAVWTQLEPQWQNTEVIAYRHEDQQGAPGVYQFKRTGKVVCHSATASNALRARGLVCDASKPVSVAEIAFALKYGYHIRGYQTWLRRQY